MPVDLTRDYPVPVSDCWSVLDPSKIKTFKQCPRQFFYEHVLGWRSKEPNLHLVFGEAWHQALEHLFNNGMSSNKIAEAYEIFRKAFHDEIPENQEDMDHPKNSGRAVEALTSYALKWERDFGNIEVLETEVAGTVPISDDRTIHFRLDNIIKRKDGNYASIDHKTGGRLSQWWIEGWYLSTQMRAYTHVLYCMYPYDQVYGVTVSGTFFLKREIKHHRVDVRPTKDSMEDWIWEINDLFDQIEWEFARLAESKEEDKVMMAFPKNESACFDYGRKCPFHDMCCAWPNPIRNVDRIPYEMEVNHWDPREREEKATKAVHIKTDKESINVNRS